MLALSRAVWDYSSNSLGVVMTHPRLINGVSDNMQRKPIAHKYRKGTMKSTLYSTVESYISLILLSQSDHLLSSKGSERDSEIAYQPYYYALYIIHLLSEVQSDRVSFYYSYNISRL